MGIANFKNMTLIKFMHGTFISLFCLELKFNDHETIESVWITN